MSGPENSFIASVHRHLPAERELYRMKNHNVYNGGIADVWYSGSKADLWIEYKFIEVPKQDGTVIDLIHPKGKKDSVISTLQQDWLTGRDAEGRTVGVIVGSKDGGVWFPDTSWNRTYDAAFFRSQLQDRKALARLIHDLVG